MFTHYNHNGTEVYQKNFSSLSELNLFLLSNPTINSKVFGNHRKIHSVNNETLGLPYDECVSYLLGGYTKDLPEILRIDSEYEHAFVAQTSERRYTKSAVGSRPNIVNYIAGSPLTMYRKEKYEDIKIVDIFFNIQSSWRTTKTQFLHRGIITYELIRLLEAYNYKVNFVVFCAAESKNEMVYYQIGIKNPDEHFILSEANTFALCAPEMFRRIIFRVMESTPVKNEDWGGNYGTKVSKEKLKEFLELSNNSILILNPKEMGISGESLEKDAQTCLDNLNLQDKINIDPEAMKLAFKKK